MYSPTFLWGQPVTVLLGAGQPRKERHPGLEELLTEHPVGMGRHAAYSSIFAKICRNGPASGLNGSASVQATTGLPLSITIAGC